MTATRIQPDRGLRHDALFYDDETGYADGLVPFLQEGVDRGDPLLVAAPAQRVELLRDRLNGSAGAVRFVDMMSLGANPNRIIPAVRGFVDRHSGRQVRFVGEPIWAGRSAAETASATRHEALINLAFADTTAHIVCPYDTAGLDPEVLADAEHTHPTLIVDREHRPSTRYVEPAEFTADDRWPLEPPPATARQWRFTELTEPREVVRRHAVDAGLDLERAAALLLAVNEVCTNSLRHGPGYGTLRVWHTDAYLICETYDTGTITDPLAGRLLAPADASGGRGLYVANHMCDLAEVRSTAGGTTVRLQVARTL